jgi:hypothetical protein
VGDDVVRMGARAFNPADDVAKAGGRALRPGRSLGAGKHRELAKGVQVIDRGSTAVGYGMDAMAPRPLTVDIDRRLPSQPRSLSRPASEPLQPYRPTPLYIERLR